MDVGKLRNSVYRDNLYHLHVDLYDFVILIKI